MTKYDEFTFTHNGAEYIAELHYDQVHGHPWDEHEGHGPVADWTSRAKYPGELILNSDRGSYRYYDFQEACRIARKDGWNAPPYDQGTSRQKAARAALADYEYLRRYCNDQWHYCGVVVRLADSCECCGDSASLWGIESDSDDYLQEVARELADELQPAESCDA